MNSILAIETSTAACSVALRYQGAVFHIFEMLPQRHAHRVLEMVDEVLEQANAHQEDIEFLAYGEGPGAFTGIRIATGVIQGLALGWNKPVIAVSSLEAMAYSALQTHDRLHALEPINWIAMMDARMQEIYWQSGFYEPNSQRWSANPPELLSQKTIKARLSLAMLPTPTPLMTGDIQNAYPELIEGAVNWFESLPTAKAVVALASKKTHTARFISEHVPVPIYLRNNVAETTIERQAKKLDQT